MGAGLKSNNQDLRNIRDESTQVTALTNEEECEPGGPRWAVLTTLTKEKECEPGKPRWAVLLFLTNEDECEPDGSCRTVSGARVLESP